MRLSLRILIPSFCLFFLPNNLLALNNTPCTATTLTVSSSCSYIYSTTVGATYSSNANNFGTPSCASPGSPDVWFQFVAPAGGSVRIQTATGTGTMTDSGMALYSTTTGACGSTGTSLACDDDSGSGSMSLINYTGLTAGRTYFVRVWKYGTSGTGSFEICVMSIATTLTNTICSNMSPICPGSPTLYTAQAAGTSAPVGPNYDCLESQPNPTWFYLEIDNPGLLSVDISANSDIDYALWGPYNSLSASKSACNSYPTPIDCSFSVSEIEQANASGAVSGKFYVLLVTNYSNVSQIIDIQQSATATATTNCSILLPIEMSSYEVKIIDQNTSIKWVTETERNNDFFLIQRSVEGSIWETIGVKKGKLNSLVENSYEYIDENPLPGISYYRLKQVDIDGNFTFTPIRSIINDPVLDFTVYPIPAKDEVKINTGNEELDHLQLFDLLGEQIELPFTQINGEYILPISALKKGVYTLVLTIGEKKINRKLIKS